MHGKIQAGIYLPEIGQRKFRVIKIKVEALPAGRQRKSRDCNNQSTQCLQYGASPPKKVEKRHREVRQRCKQSRGRTWIVAAPGSLYSTPISLYANVLSTVGKPMCKFQDIWIENKRVIKRYREFGTKNSYPEKRDQRDEEMEHASDNFGFRP